MSKFPITHHPEGSRYALVTFQQNPLVQACLTENNGCRSADVTWESGEKLPLSEVFKFSKSVERAATLADIWLDPGMEATFAEVVERYVPGKYDE